MYSCVCMRVQTSISCLFSSGRKLSAIVSASIKFNDKLSRPISHIKYLIKTSKLQYPCGIFVREHANLTFRFNYPMSGTNKSRAPSGETIWIILLSQYSRNKHIEQISQSIIFIYSVSLLPFVFNVSIFQFLYSWITWKIDAIRITRISPRFEK